MKPLIERIEADIDKLSLAEQLWLIERLAHRIRERAVPAPMIQESDLAAMANDPAIQREMKQIEIEFSVASSSVM